MRTWTDFEEKAREKTRNEEAAIVRLQNQLADCRRASLKMLAKGDVKAVAKLTRIAADLNDEIDHLKYGFNPFKAERRSWNI